MGFIRWMRNHWKFVFAILFAIAAAITVFFLVLFFPPALPFIAGISAFGFVPFAGLLTIPLSAAAIASAGLAAAVTLMACTVFNILVLCANILDEFIKPKKRPNVDDLSEFNSDDFDGSYSKASKSMSSTPKKGCCGIFGKSSKEEDSIYFDSVSSSTDEESSIAQDENESSAAAEPSDGSASMPAF
jgi:predicted permease